MRTVVLGLILAGGRSSRMGTDKALVEIDGEPMAARVRDALLAGGAETVMVVGAAPEVRGRLGLVGIDDHDPGTGPLNGIETALAAAGTFGADVALVAPCDQPRLTGGVLRDLVSALAAAPAGVGAAAFVTPDGRRHPLPAAYRTATRESVREALDGGARRADAAFDLVGVVDVPVDGRFLIDIDRPADIPLLGDDRPA